MRTLYSNHQIKEKIQEMGKQISKDYKGKNPLLLGVLKGCTIFMSHLMVEINADLEIDFMTVSSYRHGTKSEELKLVQDLDTPVKGRDVLIVEDIIDSGKTLKFVKHLLEERGAKSVEIVTFVDKPITHIEGAPKAKYVCFEYDKKDFLIGFGFDYKERYRNLPEVYMMDEEDMF